MNRNYLIWNFKISKTLFNENLLVQVDAKDVLGQYDNLVTTFSAERRGLSIYGGTARYVLARLIWKWDRH